jgi:hypothetical protein
VNGDLPVPHSERARVLSEPIDLGPRRTSVYNDVRFFSREFGFGSAVHDAVREWQHARAARLEALLREAWERTPQHLRQRLHIVWPPFDGLFHEAGVASRLDPPPPADGLYPLDHRPGCPLCGVGPDDECSMDCPSRDPNFRG